MKTYIGIRQGDSGVKVMVDLGNDGAYELPLRLDLRDHSPTGFEWGYGGSGPAQLSLAILADHFGPGGEGRALEAYQNYKWAVIARLPMMMEGWRITSEEIDQALADIEAKRLR